MKVVDEGRMLLNGQDHGSSGLNNVDMKVEAEAKVREQESNASDIIERVFCYASTILFSSHWVRALSTACCWWGHTLFCLLLSIILLITNQSYHQ